MSAPDGGKQAKVQSLFLGFHAQPKEDKPPVVTLMDSLKKHGVVKQPAREGWSDYTGRFWSTNYNTALSRGNVYVQLPDVVDPQNPVTVTAQIQYKGLYRFNSTEQFDIVMRDQNDAETKEFITQPAQVNGQSAPHGKGQLDFMVEKREGQKISGHYTLSHPKDRGQFELEKGMTHGEKCVMM